MILKYFEPYRALSWVSQVILSNFQKYLAFVGYLGLSLAILVYLGLSWTILGYLRKSRAISGYLLYRVISGYIQLPQAISDYLMLFLAISDYIRISLAILGYLQLSSYLCQSQTIWGYIRQYSAISSYTQLYVAKYPVYWCKYKQERVSYCYLKLLFFFFPGRVIKELPLLTSTKFVHRCVSCTKVNKVKICQKSYEVFESLNSTTVFGFERL